MIEERLYECTEVTKDPTGYGVQTAHLDRADGYLGWLTITGPDVYNVFRAGGKYRLTVREEE